MSLRKYARNIALDILGFYSSPSKGVHILNGHLLSLDNNLSSDFFYEQLKKLNKKSTIIPFNEGVELITKKKEFNHSLIAFSYDDGFEECFTHIAPVLEEFNGCACFFLNPNFIDGDIKYRENFLKNRVHLPNYKQPMNWNQINLLKDKGHIIGAHTMDHIKVSELHELKEIEFQIGDSKKRIEDKIGCNCDYFAFPYGHIERDFNINHVAIAEKHYKYIFSASNSGYYYSYDGRVLNRRHSEPYWKAKHTNYFISNKISY